MEEHKEHFRLVLQTLREHHLYSKFSKCDFFKEEIQYLGHIITKEGIAVDPEKIRTIMEWPVPKDVADIRSFMGSHYARHPGYQEMITTLQKEYYLPGMKKNVAKYLAWCLECQQIKAEHQHLAGLLQPLPIPEWKWKIVSMDFMTGLPKTRKNNDSIMVVVDKLSKAPHFIL
eukprot:PITA_21530